MQFENYLITIVITALLTVLARDLWGSRTTKSLVQERILIMGQNLYENYLKLNKNIIFSEQDLNKFLKTLIVGIKQFTEAKTISVYIFEDSLNHQLVQLGGDLVLPPSILHQKSQEGKMSQFFEGQLIVLNKSMVEELKKGKYFQVQEEAFFHFIPLLQDNLVYGFLAIENTRKKIKQLKNLEKYLHIMTNCVVNLLNQKKSSKKEFELAEITALTVTQRYLSEFGRRSQDYSKGISVAHRTKAVLGINTDLIEAVLSTQGNTYFLTLDIAGKGVPSAIASTIVRTLFLDGVYKDKKPGEILNHINASLKRRLNLERYGSVSICMYDANARLLTTTGTAPLHLLNFKIADKSSSQIHFDGPPIALQKSSTYEEKTVKMEPGDIVIAYTDGLSEAQNAFGGHFGMKNIIKILMNYYAHSVHDFSENLMKEIMQFTDGEELHDDLSFLIIKAE